MAHDLKEIQSIDPSVKRLEDLPDSFFDFIAANLSGKQAYFAAKALEQSEQVSSPAPTGKVSQAGEEKDFFTADEVRSMSPEEVHKNFEKIRRSQSRW